MEWRRWCCESRSTCVVGLASTVSKAGWCGRALRCAAGRACPTTASGTWSMGIFPGAVRASSAQFPKRGACRARSMACSVEGGDLACAGTCKREKGLVVLAGGLGPNATLPTRRRVQGEARARHSSTLERLGWRAAGGWAALRRTRVPASQQMTVTQHQRRPVTFCQRQFISIPHHHHHRPLITKARHFPGPPHSVALGCRKSRQQEKL